VLADIETLLLSLSKDAHVLDFFFVGGTALGYYLDHRISYGIDLISSSKLDVKSLMALSVTHDARFVPDHDASRFRINTGSDLREYKMAFNIRGIKVEFFYPNDPIRLAIIDKHKQHSPIIHGMKILPIEAIAELKLLAFFARKKIRDLFDILILLQEDRLDIDTIDKYTALKYKKTFAEYVEEFEDDQSESLDFDAHHKYDKILTGKSFDDRENFLKEQLIDIYTQKMKK